MRNPDDVMYIIKGLGAQAAMLGSASIDFYDVAGFNLKQDAYDNSSSVGTGGMERMRSVCIYIYILILWSITIIYIFIKKPSPPLFPFPLDLQPLPPHP